ncbi:putative nuclease HARBI1 [Prorops nasuta]|uniref:putative nuclease HARBI1 n=1 Tax=Prorops nasuta TaxID=863751 RepID=UPI0034CD28B4
MATMDSYRSIGDRFNVGKATTFRAVKRVSRALFNIAPYIIRWPSSAEAQTVKEKFQQASGFPGVIGAIDGTHIKIDAPNKNPADIINRKGYHSIQLQVVCNHRALFTHCFAGYPGSLHDQRVFKKSEVFDYLQDATKFPTNTHLVGDAAYELHQHLLVPFKDNGHLTDAQIKYNFQLSSTRIVVERSFALLKGKMRSLLHCLPMTRVELIPEYIIACCTIHNISLLHKNELSLIIRSETQNTHSTQNSNVGQDYYSNGSEKRNAIMNSLR